MATVELTYPTTLWDLVSGDTDRDGVVATMVRRLPEEGMAGPAMPRRFRLTTATFRLLDSRILRAALESLDLDVADTIVRGLTGYQRLADAARATLPPAGTGEVTVVLVQPAALPWTDDFDVVMRVDGRPIATFAFTLHVTVELGETSVVVRGGAVDRVTCQLASVTASLMFAGWPTPLWAPEKRSLPVSLVVRPPLAIPLGRPGPASTVPGPRRTPTDRAASVTDDSTG
jgi:hypothetical protein